MDDLYPIAPGLWLLPAEHAGRFPFSHCVVIRGEVDALVDAGCGAERLRSLTRRWRPERVLVSHAHPDHCSGLWMLEGTRIASPKQGAESFWRFAAESRRFVGDGPLAERWIAFAGDVVGMREVAADEHFDDGDVIDLGNIRLECVHAPGHTDDHYVFFEPTHGVALTFDIDLTPFGPWYGHEESDIDAFLTSIERVAELRPRVLVSSHKGIITSEIEARLRQYADVIDRRDGRLLQVLRTPRTLAEMIAASPFYGGHPYAAELLRYWEGVMIGKHLDRLQRRGDVVRDKEVWRRG